MSMSIQCVSIKCNNFFFVSKKGNPEGTIYDRQNDHGHDSSCQLTNIHWSCKN